MSTLLTTLLVACSSADPAPPPLAAEAVSFAPVHDTGPRPTPWEVAQTPSVEATPQPAGERSTWRARRGESLAHFARWSELPVEDIAAASGLDLTAPLDVGAPIVVPGGEEVRGRVAAARDRHHVRRAASYLESRGGSVGTTFYPVRTGDTAWRVAQDELGVPLWLLETYNPHVDLERLRPGQQLMAPVLGDTVAEAPTPDSPEAP